MHVIQPHRYLQLARLSTIRVSRILLPKNISLLHAIILSEYIRESRQYSKRYCSPSETQTHRLSHCPQRIHRGMSGVGEILGGIALVEPCFKACLEAYGFYKLTKNFGHDYQKAERALRGQAARLRVLGDTRINNLLLVPEEGTQLAETTISTLQGMSNNFEQCEVLMKAHGEPRRFLLSRSRILWIFGKHRLTASCDI
jgi:hypothetical protein